MQRGSILSPVVLSSLLAATAGCSAGERPATPPSGATALLGLGDSLTYGAHSLTDVSLPTTGYVDDFDNMLVPPPPITNYGCPGETSASFLGLTAPCPFQGMHPLHTRFSGTQVSAATTFLAGAPNAAVLLSVGGNDARAFLQGCGSPNPDPACVSSQLPSAVAAYGANLSMILDALEAQSASAPIIVINLYNPFRTGTAADVQTDGFIGAFNATLANVALAHQGVRVADAFGTFKAAFLAGSPSTIGPDVHPTDYGYQLIAKAVSQVFMTPNAGG